MKVSSVMSDSLWPHELYNPWNSPGQNTRVDSLSLLQGIFPTQELNPGLLHCKWIFFTSWATREAQTCGIVNFHVTLSIPLILSFLPSPISTGLFSMSVSPLRPWKLIHQYHVDSIYMCQYTIFMFLFLTYFTLYNKS